MIYDISHRTTYIYRASVPFARCLLRLMPGTRAGQSTRDAIIEIDPAPGFREDGTDFFGNRISRVTLSVPHQRVVIRARATVEVHAPAPPAGDPAIARIRAEVLESRDLAGNAPVHGLFPTRHVPLIEGITRYAGESLDPGRPVLAALDELTARIRADFTYDPKATDIATPAARAFAARRGVCQDFAHIMIAGLRGAGLPARYVSGYLRTVPPPGQPRLEGADAMHAWVEVWAGEGAGWVGFDPTNGIRAGEDHVVVATGRDYADVSPIDGVVRVAGGQDMAVAVDVVPRDPRLAQPPLPAVRPATTA
jgi:transglutaminase-like putative cysteine protease